MKKLYSILKKDVIIALLIAGVGIAIAYIINLALTYGNFIPTVISNDTWLAFWGGYCCGIFALIIGYLAIRHSNRNSEKAIYQQLLVNTRQLLSSLKQMGCNEDNDEYQHSQKELTNIQNNLKVIDSQINTYISDIDLILKNIQPVYFALLDKSKHLFNLSVLLIEEQEKRLNY